MPGDTTGSADGPAGGRLPEHRPGLLPLTFGPADAADLARRFWTALAGDLWGPPAVTPPDAEPHPTEAS
jgi:hypothetical protein